MPERLTSKFKKNKQPVRREKTPEVVIPKPPVQDLSEQELQPFGMMGGRIASELRDYIDSANSLDDNRPQIHHETAVQMAVSLLPLDEGEEKLNQNHLVLIQYLSTVLKDVTDFIAPVPNPQRNNQRK